MCGDRNLKINISYNKLTGRSFVFVDIYSVTYIIYTALWIYSPAKLQFLSLLYKFFFCSCDSVDYKQEARFLSYLQGK